MLKNISKADFTTHILLCTVLSLAATYFDGISASAPATNLVEIVGYNSGAPLEVRFTNSTDAQVADSVIPKPYPTQNPQYASLPIQDTRVTVKSLRMFCDVGRRDFSANEIRYLKKLKFSLNGRLFVRIEAEMDPKWIANKQLLEKTKTGDIPGIAQALRNGARLTAQDDQGNNVFHIAARLVNPAIFTYLLALPAPRETIRLLLQKSNKAGEFPLTLVTQSTHLCNVIPTLMGITQ